MTKDKIKFDIKNVAYVVHWDYPHSYSGDDGCTVVRDIFEAVWGKLKKRDSPSTQCGLCVCQFKDLEKILMGKSQEYVEEQATWEDAWRNSYRSLDKEELNLVYNSIKNRLVENLRPTEFEGILKIFYEGRIIFPN